MLLTLPDFLMAKVQFIIKELNRKNINALANLFIIKWCHDLFQCGYFAERKVKPGYKRQWRWRCAHRDALKVAKIIWPYAQVKLHKLEQLIDHYEPRIQEPGDNVVDLETEREIRRIWP